MRYKKCIWKTQNEVEFPLDGELNIKSIYEYGPIVYLHEGSGYIFPICILTDLSYIKIPMISLSTFQVKKYKKIIKDEFIKNNIKNRKYEAIHVINGNKHGLVIISRGKYTL